MTLIANLRHAARNRETVTIGGGEFGPAELLEAARVLELHSQLLIALKDSDKLISQLMPGVAHIALQDYAFLNNTLMANTSAINASESSNG